MFSKDSWWYRSRSTTVQFVYYSLSLSYVDLLAYLWQKGREPGIKALFVASSRDSSCSTWFTVGLHIWTVTYWSVFPNFLEHFALEMELKLACNKGGWLSRCHHRKTECHPGKALSEEVCEFMSTTFRQRLSTLVSESPYFPLLFLINRVLKCSFLYKNMS